MLSHSLNDAARRGAWTCLSCSKAWIVSPSRPLTARTHQRHHSSSKPSSPPENGSTRAVADPGEAPSKEAATPAAAKERSDQHQTSTRVGRRKAKDTIPQEAGRSKNEISLKTPSAPSTQALKPQDIHVASFFSIHRPISVTTFVPTTSTTTAFSTIFAPKIDQKSQHPDVTHTLSSTLETLETTSSSLQYPQMDQLSTEETDLHAAVARALSGSSFSANQHQPHETLHPTLNDQELTRHFRPFIPPPPPVAKQSACKHARKISATKQKSYSATLTILEKIFPNGNKAYETRLGRFHDNNIPDTSPFAVENVSSDIATAITTTDVTISTPFRLPRHQQPFLNRLRLRQQQWEAFREREPGRRQVWRAISVKRQRRLKIKKHKYKKLMRRTRNLRRKLDRK